MVACVLSHKQLSAAKLKKAPSSTLKGPPLADTNSASSDAVAASEGYQRWLTTSGLETSTLRVADTQSSSVQTTSEFESVRRDPKDILASYLKKLPEASAEEIDHYIKYSRLTIILIGAPLLVNDYEHNSIHGSIRDLILTVSLCWQVIILAQAVRNEEYSKHKTNAEYDLQIPQEASIYYDPSLHGKASDFLLALYGKRIEEGTISRNILKGIDENLLCALEAEYNERLKELKSSPLGIFAAPGDKMPETHDAADVPAADKQNHSVGLHFTPEVLELNGMLEANIISASDVREFIRAKREGAPDTSVAANTSPPEPPKFRVKVDGQASAFLNEHYTDPSQRTQKYVRETDTSLYKALEREFDGNRAGLKRLLATVSDAADKKLEAALGRPARPDERKRLLSSMATIDAAKNKP